MNNINKLENPAAKTGEPNHCENYKWITILIYAKPIHFMMALLWHAKLWLCSLLTAFRTGLTILIWDWLCDLLLSQNCYGKETQTNTMILIRKNHFNSLIHQIKSSFQLKVPFNWSLADSYILHNLFCQGFWLFVLTHFCFHFSHCHWVMWVYWPFKDYSLVTEPQ